MVSLKYISPGLSLASILENFHTGTSILQTFGIEHWPARSCSDGTLVRIKKPRCCITVVVFALDEITDLHNVQEARGEVFTHKYGVAFKCRQNNGLIRSNFTTFWQKWHPIMVITNAVTF